MQRRTVWIIVGSVVGALLVMCSAIAGIGWYTTRQLQRQEEQVADIFATIEAGLPTPVAAERETPGANLPARTPEPAIVTTSPPITSTTGVEMPDATSGVAASASDAAVDAIATALVTGSRGALAQHANATLYEIEARLDPNRHTISGQQVVRYTNTEEKVLDSLYFRLYVNAPHYNEGGIVVEDVRLNGAAAASTLEQDDTTLQIALDEPLRPGQSVDVTMRFTTTVPTSGGGYGIFNESQGVWTLYNWHPEVAVYEKGGWLLNPISEQGDPTNTDVANYEVMFAAPQDYTIVTSGVDAGTVPPTSGEVPSTYTVHSSAVALARNFVVVASNRFEHAMEQVGETRVSSYYLPDSQAGGQATLDTTARSLEIFSSAFGPYPYTELDVAQVDLMGAAGMEATGLIMIGSNLYESHGTALDAAGDAVPGVKGADALAFTTAHEVAHQWWYGVVGSDAYNEPWLDESLTNWSSAYYVDEAEGEEAGKFARDLFIGFGYQAVLGNGDQRLDQPVDQFDGRAYSGIVYGKGALMYDVLRQELGDEKFFEFLRRYYREQQFDRADGDEWLQTLNAVAGRDMTPFYRKWVEGTSITRDDLPSGGLFSDFLGGLDNLLSDESPAP